jgi:uncharacterized RDD family membrane protein YckC
VFVSAIIYWGLTHIFISSFELEKFQRLRTHPQALKSMIETVKLITMLSAISNLLPAWLYYVGFECSAKQATLGKQLLGLMVYSKHGITFGMATKRFLIKYMAFFAPLVIAPMLSAGCFGVAILIIPMTLILVVSGIISLLDPIVVLFNSDRCGLHDMVADTKVIKEKPVGFIQIALSIICLVIIIVLSVSFAIFTQQIVFPR